MEAAEKERLKELEKSMNDRQKKFCHEYIYEWHQTRSYKVAYPDVKNDNVAAVNAHNLLRNPKISEYIELIQLDIAKLAGISRLKVVNELKAMSFSNIASTRTTWMKLKDFEELNEDELKAIKDVQFIAKEIGMTKRKEVHVKITLHDKQKSIEILNKMLGFNEPEKREIEIDAPDGIIQIGYGDRKEENEE